MSRTRLRLAAAGLLALCLLPILLAPLPPLQDLPQHLLAAQALARQGAAGWQLDDWYTVRLLPGPYAPFYLWLAGWLRAGCPPLWAARLTLLLGPGLLFWFISSARRVSPALLLLIPLYFGHFFFLGFVSFHLSLPLLLLALRADHEARGAPHRGRAAWGWALALTAAHPFSALAFCGLAGADAALALRAKATPRALLRPLAVGGLVLAWMALGNALGDSGAVGAQPAQWTGPGASLVFTLTRLTGLAGGERADLISLGLWGLVAMGAVARAVTPQRAAAGPAAAAPAPAAAGPLDGAGTGPSPPFGLWALCCLAALLALPFRRAGYTYINLRAGAIGLLLLPWWLATRPAAPPRPGWLGRLPGPAVLALLLGVRLAWIGGALSLEFAQAHAVLAAVPSGSRVLPLIHEPEAGYLDRAAFDLPLHLAMYAQLDEPGGLTPYLFETGVNPLRLGPGLPGAPGEYTPEAFDPARHCDWDWIVVHRAPTSQTSALERCAVPVVSEGPWTLWQVQPDG